jgi:flagellar biosynthesis chaperone FliJ
MSELSIPVATIIGAEMTQHTICESIKSLRDSYREFCEEDEFVETIIPIEQDPEPYANGTKKTRPILKKYAQALLDKIILDQQLEAEAEAQRDANLTPQQVKADMKRYVSICEKKIAKQQEQCDALQKQVEQLMDVVSLLASPDKGISKLSMAMNMKITTVEELLLNGMNCLEEKDIMFATSIKSVEKLLLWGANIDYIYHTLMLFPGFCNSVGKLYSIDVRGSRVFLDPTKKHYIPITSMCEKINLLNLGPYNTNEIQIVYKCIFGRELTQPVNKRSYQEGSYNLTPLKFACLRSSLEMVKFLHEKGAKIGDTTYHVPNGPEGDLVAGYLQTHGSSPVTRF